MSPLHDMQWDAFKMSSGATGHVAVLAKLIEPGPFNRYATTRDFAEVIFCAVPNSKHLQITLVPPLGNGEVAAVVDA